MNYVRIGLTGGPGCGKSAARKIFSSFPGWITFDADQICHEIYSEKNTPFAKILKSRWGEAVFNADGTPDRKAIAEKIFADETEREWLDSVLHPEIFFRLENRTAQSCARFILIEVSLLFEVNWQTGMEQTIAVWSPPQLQLARLLERGWTQEHAARRIAAQFPSQKKLELADYGIVNAGSLENLEEQCRRIDREIRTKFQS